jgi:hypothetical protein
VWKLGSVKLCLLLPSESLTERSVDIDSRYSWLSRTRAMRWHSLPRLIRIPEWFDISARALTLFRVLEELHRRAKHFCEAFYIQGYVILWTTCSFLRIFIQQARGYGFSDFEWRPLRSWKWLLLARLSQDLTAGEQLAERRPKVLELLELWSQGDLWHVCIEGS